MQWCTNNFSKGKRGTVVRVPKGKARITIRVDDDILDSFRNQVEEAGGGNYQTLINNAWVSMSRIIRTDRDHFAKGCARRITQRGPVTWCVAYAQALGMVKVVKEIAEKTKGETG